MAPQSWPHWGRPQHHLGGGARCDERVDAAGTHAGGGALFPLRNHACWIGGFHVAGAADGRVNGRKASLAVVLGSAGPGCATVDGQH